MPFLLRSPYVSDEIFRKSLYIEAKTCTIPTYRVFVQGFYAGANDIVCLNFIFFNLSTL